MPDTVQIGGTSYAVTAIADNAFKGSAAKAITVGNNVTQIKAKSFNGAAKLTSLTLGKNVKSVAPKAFKSNKKLKTITLKTSKLSAKVLKKTLKGSKVKTIKVSVAKKMKKKLVKQYKKALKSMKIAVK